MRLQLTWEVIRFLNTKKNYSQLHLRPVITPMEFLIDCTWYINGPMQLNEAKKNWFISYKVGRSSPLTKLKINK